MLVTNPGPQLVYYLVTSVTEKKFLKKKQGFKEIPNQFDIVRLKTQSEKYMALKV